MVRCQAPTARHALGLLLVGLLLIAPACEGEPPAGPLGQGGLPTGTAAFRLVPFRAATPSPTASPTPQPPPRAGPLVWVGGEAVLSVLGPGGWQTFALEGIVRDIAVDAQGNAIVAPGLYMCDGRLLRALLPRAPGAEQDAVAVDPQGRIWAGYYGGIAVLEGGRWRTIPIEGSPTQSRARTVRDVASDSQGGIWVATGAGLLRYDGRSWQRYEAAGLGGIAIDCLVVDGQGRVWVAHEKGLSVLQGRAWQHWSLEETGFVRHLAAAPGGRILAGTLYRGLAVLSGQAWQTMAEAGSGLPGSRITALAADGLGRIWVGSRSGLGVYDGGRWLTYQEANSGLGDDQVWALAVGGGALATLPTPAPVRYGRLEGRVTVRGQPAAGVRVVLCSDLPLGGTFGDHPCEGAPYSRLGRTGADGRYAFDRVPVGHYAVAAEVDRGRWVACTRVLSAVRYPVRAAETTVAETIEGAQ